MSSSFKRAGAPPRPTPPPGTHLSIQNGQLLTSSGLSDFDDNVVSGGLILGTVTLIEEDLNTLHYQSLCKYLLAEGAANGHALMVVSASANPRDVLRTLPGVISEEEHRGNIQAEQPDTEDVNRLKIAWRYRDNSGASSGATSQQRKTIAHAFDLSRSISSDLLVPNKIEVIQLPLDSNEPFRALYDSIAKAISKHHCDAVADASKEPRNVMRILLQSFGSPLWCSTSEQQQQLQFLHALRGLVRNAYAVCYITVPSHLFTPLHQRRVQHLCDTSVRLQSFQGEPSATSFNKYNGLLHVTRMPRLNSLTPPLQEATVFGYMTKRKRFYIEQLNIPPADDSGPSSNNSDGSASSSPAGMLCVPRKASALEF